MYLYNTFAAQLLGSDPFFEREDLDACSQSDHLIQILPSKGGESKRLLRPKNRMVIGFTLLELLVVISIIVILASLVLPNVLMALTKGQMAQTLSNERQLYLATQAMAVDGVTMGDPNLGWPGDMPSPSFSTWASALCPGYLSTNDFCKLCSAPGVVVSMDKMPTQSRETAFKIYPVQETSDGNAIFLITRNATVQGEGTSTTITLDPSVKPYGNKGCVIMHRGGDGEILLPNQLKNARAIGVVGTNAALL